MSGQGSWHQMHTLHVTAASREAFSGGVQQQQASWHWRESQTQFVVQSRTLMRTGSNITTLLLGKQVLARLHGGTSAYYELLSYAIRVGA
jgi:hypothetical protein